MNKTNNNKKMVFSMYKNKIQKLKSQRNKTISYLIQKKITISIKKKILNFMFNYKIFNIVFVIK